MKFSNFRLTERTGKNALDWNFKAIVTITTGFWLFKKQKDVEIYKKFAGYWCFTETGRFTPLNYAEQAQRKFEADRMCKIEVCAV